MSMLRRLHLTLFALMLISFSCIEPAQNELLNLAKQIISSSYRTDPTKDRQKLLETFKGVQYANAVTLFAILDAYHYRKETLLYPTHEATLKDAIKKFNTTPGFALKIYEFLLNTNNESFVQGHIYEIEMALFKHNAGETITHFGYSFYCNNTPTHSTVDLATTHEFIECKNIHWKSYYNDNHLATKKLKKQLLNYKRLAHDPAHNKPFKLYSKQPITPSWEQWFQDHEINAEHATC